jgi:hypothetical protein
LLCNKLPSDSKLMSFKNCAKLCLVKILSPPILAKSLGNKYFYLQENTLCVTLFQSLISVIFNCFSAHSKNLFLLFTSWLYNFGILENFHGNHSNSLYTVANSIDGDPLYTVFNNVEPPNFSISYFS